MAATTGKHLNTEADPEADGEENAEAVSDDVALTDTDTGGHAEDAETPGDPDDSNDADDPNGPESENDGELFTTKRGDSDPDRHGLRRWGRRVRRSALPVLLVASLSVSGFLGWRQWQAHQIKLAGEQAQQAAINYAQVLTSIDSNNVDENFRQVLDGATGEFKDMYTQSSVQLRQLLIDNRATAHGVVVDSAIASESMDKVVVLVFVDQTVTNLAVPDPRIDRSRIKMTMEKIDGRWRASKVQLL
ncbi:hypothetical protein MB901379_04698 [Mycobacterium basiliense]|uniref:Tetratricopeptide repeat-like domain-containing protein n=1 Tax=Mycobacterium basiliense TaxID=2094119 RepID=A0A3S4BI13_9MYCO|nr:tetratricopeptide repeat protein [Mycobacterium basiliense]VDM91084.1 hypothetical protein MB901379_04698 [Mycobacterium basiliense]